jgi:hypothetical protein
MGYEGGFAPRGLCTLTPELDSRTATAGRPEVTSIVADSIDGYAMQME